MCRRESETIKAGPDRFVPTAPDRSECAGRRILRCAQEDAGGRQNSARWIIGSDSERNRAGEKGSPDRQHPESIQYFGPKIGTRLDLLREGKARVYPVGSNWRKQKFVGQVRQS